MSKFLAEVNGFTPVIDVVAQDVGLMSAVVYGVVWRYCQMEDGRCTASIQNIADRAGISRKTAERHMKKLVEAGYLTRIAERNHAPCEYADTGKVKIEGLLAARGKSESPTTGKVSQKVLPGKSESPTRSDTKSHLGKSESPTKIPIQDTSQESSKKQLAARAPPASKLTAGQRQFLDKFGAKRFKTNVQRDAVLAMEQKHGTTRLLEGATWASKCGMNVGKAIVSLETALPKWGQPKGQKQNAPRVEIATGLGERA